MNEIFAAIRDAGVMLYEREGIVSFRDPEKEQNTAMVQVMNTKKSD